jgi:sterol desaturase/sphingolipid hydroxylase (fatty acid hydroxylase superfamily)
MPQETNGENLPQRTPEREAPGDTRFGLVVSTVAYPLAVSVTIGGATLAVRSGVGVMYLTLLAALFMFATGLLLEWLVPYQTQQGTRPSAGIEIANSAINMVLNSRVFGPLLALGSMKLSVAVVGRSGLLPSSELGPWWLQAILAFLLMDASRYFVHRAQHQVPALWRFHRIHHSVEKMRTVNVQFSHPFDYLLRNVLTIYVPVLLGFSEPAVILAVVIELACGLPSHYNARLRFGPLNYLLVTCRIHRWHHSTDIDDGGNTNFGAGTVIWDRLFGTFHHPLDRDGPKQTGVEEGPPRSIVPTLFIP